MPKRFRSNTLNAQRLPFYLALVVLGVTGCSSDPANPNPGAAGAAHSAGGPAVGGQGGGVALAGSGNAPAGGSGGAAAGTGGAAAGSGDAAAGTGGTAPTGGSGGAGGHVAGGAGPGGGSAGVGMGGGGAADCSSFSLCDDFEGAAPGATTSPWKVSMGSGYTVEVVSTPVHGGTHAVHMSAPTATGGGYLTATKGFPATDFWGRAWVRVKSAAGGHQCLMALNATPNNGVTDQVRILNEMGSGEVATNLRSNDKLNDASATKVPQDTWFCYEWHQSPSALQVYIDSAEVTKAAASWSVASINSLQIGIQRFQAGTAKADFYYDDVAVNATRVGCN
jgi:hypothetical protein